ncbi:class A beta-lactamase [Aquincola sp. J276]|uniref:class A beta-lactamase n=1 Tax=Aquincola sp. J276 TaxID=2898432 RepID=UPI00215190BC|nr:class A beta-lactamase [Aquincola sp. J276]MCR5867925.1 class A beta-lactamase [Aquincola sp. J276]
MHRRSFTTGMALALATGWQAAAASKTSGSAADGPPDWAAIEAGVGGRLGVSVLDTGSGQVTGHRLDERFPMCSTFKWLAAAHVLQRVDAGLERLDRRIVYGPEVLIAHSPVTQRHADGSGMTLAALCKATVTVSDNAAANLILQTLGGPAGLTAFVRTLGDAHTRLDRTEPELNEATPGDPRDTTTPRAMAGALQRAVLGNALSPAGRQQLAAWLEAASTGFKRLRAAVPAGWRAGDKTGTGSRGTANDVAVFWPPAAPPLVVCAYLTDSSAAPAQRDAALAEVGRQAVQRHAAAAGAKRS